MSLLEARTFAAEHRFAKAGAFGASSTPSHHTPSRLRAGGAGLERDVGALLPASGLRLSPKKGVLFIWFYKWTTSKSAGKSFRRAKPSCDTPHYTTPPTRTQAAAAAVEGDAQTSRMQCRRRPGLWLLWPVALLLAFPTKQGISAPKTLRTRALVLLPEHRWRAPPRPEASTHALPNTHLPLPLPLLDHRPPLFPALATNKP